MADLNHTTNNAVQEALEAVNRASSSAKVVGDLITTKSVSPAAIEFNLSVSIIIVILAFSFGYSLNQKSSLLVSKNAYSFLVVQLIALTAVCSRSIYQISYLLLAKDDTDILNIVINFQILSLGILALWLCVNSSRLAIANTSQVNKPEHKPTPTQNDDAGESK